MIDKIITFLKSQNIPVEETAFNHQVKPPYACYNISISMRGADNKNNISYNNATVELYQSKRNKNIEKSIENLFQSVEFSKETVYIESEKIYMTVYEFEIISKI